MASFIYGISEELRKLGVLMVRKTLEEIDQHLRKSENGHGSLRKTVTRSWSLLSEQLISRRPFSPIKNRAR